LEGKTLSPKNAALEELAQYLGVSKNSIEQKMLVEVPVAAARNEYNPDIYDEHDITNFYRTTDAYIFELMAANHIVQTLYSYFILAEKLKQLPIKTILDY